jgi:hypothetical protein
MERNDAQTDRGGGGLSTQDLLEAEPRKEQAPKEQAPKGKAPKGEAPEGHVTETKTDEPGPQLFAEQEVGEFREQWQVIQTSRQPSSTTPNMLCGRPTSWWQP